jgi:hypothetical protein
LPLCPSSESIALRKAGSSPVIVRAWNLTLLELAAVFDKLGASAFDDGPGKKARTPSTTRNRGVRFTSQSYARETFGTSLEFAL